MAIVLGRVADAQLDDAAVERSDPLQLRARRSHPREARVQRLDHTLSRHRARHCVRVLVHHGRGETRDRSDQGGDEAQAVKMRESCRAAAKRFGVTPFVEADTMEGYDGTNNIMGGLRKHGTSNTTKYTFHLRRFDRVSRPR